MLSPRDAFAVLMTGQRRLDQDCSPHVGNCSPRKSSFTLCPLGCGKNIALSTMSLHIDQCVKVDSVLESNHQLASQPSDRPNALDKDVCTCKDGFLDSRNNNASKAKRKNSPCDERNDRKDEKLLRDANSLLMQHSKQFYQRCDRVIINHDVPKQRFHLHDNSGRVSWNTCDSNEVGSDQVLWESSVCVKHSIDVERDLVLIVSSSIPSYSPIQHLHDDMMKKINLVENKSKLSVPVLKSILQKSIRRKRPLPATKVAMELAEKSLGDLLRRLPIIMLEDSTLHPDFPFLVWLMVAESKNFNPPIDLLTRLMRIVFEIAACNFKDTWVQSDNTMIPTDQYYIEQNVPSKWTLFTSQNEMLRLGFDEKCILFMKTILLRKHYGGMAGDMQMLQDYVETWGTRFEQNIVPDEIRERLEIEPSIMWKSVPTLIHHKMLEDSISVTEVVRCKLKFLSFYDTVISGIDFHCSNVVEHLLADPHIYSKVSFHIQCHHLQDGAPSKEDLCSIIRQSIWHCCSGVNSKRLIHGNINQDTCRETQQLWTDVLKEPHRIYATNYIISRLVSRDIHQPR